MARPSVPLSICVNLVILAICSISEAGPYEDMKMIKTKDSLQDVLQSKEKKFVVVLVLAPNDNACNDNCITYQDRCLWRAMPDFPRKFLCAKLDRSKHDIGGERFKKSGVEIFESGKNVFGWYGKSGTVVNKGSDGKRFTECDTFVTKLIELQGE